MARSAPAVSVGRQPLALARAVPAWAWLAGLVALSALFRYALARRSVAPWIMVDELVYSELAKSFASSGRLLIRDHPVGLSYGFAYPVLISPAYRLFAAPPQAYAAIKVINAVLMSSTAVPVYLLARRVVSRSLAVAAAVLALAVPALLYTGTVMTENAFYPIFTWAALLLVLVLERPTWWRSLVLFAVSGLAFFTRAQGLLLVPAALTAPLVLVYYDGSGWRGLRRFAPLAGVLGSACVLAAAFELVRGRSPTAVLGAYQAATGLGYSPWPVVRSFAYHVAELDLSLAIAPFAALVVLAGLGRQLPRRAAPFLAAALALWFWTVAEVATFASALVPFRVEERNMFYVAPLLIISLLAWVELGAPRPARWTPVAAIASAALPAILPYPSLIATSAVSDTFGLLPWWTVHLWGIPLDRLVLVVSCACAAVGALFLFVPRRYALAVPGVVLAAFALSLQPVSSRIEEASLGALFQATTKVDRDWIDRRVGRNASVAVVYSGKVDRFVVNENEFFNRSVGPVYDLAAPTPGGLPEALIALDRGDGRLLGPDGRAVRVPFALTDMSVPLGGERVARDLRKGLTLYRAARPLAVTTDIRGLYDDLWSGPNLTYTRFACRGGTVSAQIDSDPNLFRTAQTVVARAAGRVATRARLAPTATRRLDVPLTADGARCRVVFSVRPTKVPGGADQRRLGVHFRRFVYRR